MLGVARLGPRSEPVMMWILQSEARRCCSWPITPTACGDGWLEEAAWAWRPEEAAWAWWLEEAAWDWRPEEAAWDWQPEEEACA
jgi:hypothetical protein